MSIFLFTFLIKYIFIIQFLTSTFVETVELPFHANYLNGSTSEWECNQGYFKTYPTNPMLSTCKKCSPFNETSCPSDTAFIKCTHLHDSKCSSCKPLIDNDAWIYSPQTHDCSSVECNAGYFNDSGSCSPCPIGSYCVRGLRSRCGNELTTFSIKTSSSLGCTPTVISAAWQIQIIFYFDTLSSINKIDFCSSPKNDLIAVWLRYGRLVDCVGMQVGDETTFLESYTAQISCRILVSKQYTAEYMVWLTDEVEKHKPTIVAELQKCINSADISSWEVQILTLSPDTFYYNLTSSSSQEVNEVLPPPRDSPNFAVIGSGFFKGQDIAIFVFSMSILTCSISLSICFIITGFILRFRRKNQRSTTHANQMAQITALV